MKKSRFTEEQIAYALKQAELGTAVGEICRKMRHSGGHVLRVAQEVRWVGSVRALAPAASGRGKSQAQVTGGGPEPGQGDAPAGGHKKL